MSDKAAGGWVAGIVAAALGLTCSALAPDDAAAAERAGQTASALTASALTGGCGPTSPAMAGLPASKA